MTEEDSIMDLLADRPEEEIVEDVPTEEEEVSFVDAGEAEEEEAQYIPEPEVAPVQTEPSSRIKTVDEVPETRASTEPWTQSGNPWAIDVLAMRFKHRGFRPRFVSKGTIETKKDQGWVMANCRDYNVEPTPGQGDTLIRRKGMLLMEIPEELANSREAYFKKKIKTQSNDARQKEVTEARRMGRQVGLGDELDIKDIR